MLDFVIGKKGNPKAVDALIDVLRNQDWDGTVYIGYPIFSVDESTAITDALLTCKEHGVVIFDFSPIPSLEDASQIEGSLEMRQSDLYRGLHNRLFGYRELTKNKGRDLAVDINVLTLLPNTIPGLSEANIDFVTPSDLLKRIQSYSPLEESLIKSLNAAIQKTAALKPRKKRLAVKKSDSMGAIIKKIEAEVANLDKWQKNAAIETPEGPQRIRGLAGSGKTIILAMI